MIVRVREKINVQIGFCSMGFEIQYLLAFSCAVHDDCQNPGLLGKKQLFFGLFVPG